MDRNDAIREIKNIAGLTGDFDRCGECGGFPGIFDKDAIDEGSTGNAELREICRREGGVLVVDPAVAEVVGLDVANVEPVDGCTERVSRADQVGECGVGTDESLGA